MPKDAPISGHVDSYFICATPRTGSSLLCGLLDATGVAGHPESYFRHEDHQSWVARWGIRDGGEEARSYAQFVTAAIATGRTDNGLFGARTMWETLGELVENLRAMDPDPDGNDLDVLTRAFGPTRFVYLRRDDVVGQAVSWFRAEQTDVWVETEDAGPSVPSQTPHYEFRGIHQLVHTINDHNAAWREWFASVGVQPHAVSYHDLDVDPIGVTADILEFLGMELPLGRELNSRHRRLADDLNARWIARYGAEVVHHDERSVPGDGR